MPSATRAPADGARISHRLFVVAFGARKGYRGVATIVRSGK